MEKQRSTFLIGNGLGMALDSEYFTLEAALASAWSETNSAALDHGCKKQVLRCLNRVEENAAPTSEEELEVLQRVVAACDFLDDVGEGDIAWLSVEGAKFPQAVRRYFGLSAAHFHGHDKGLPDSFVDSFCAYLKDTNSHVATLNYDNLLYQRFIDNTVCKGYDGCLVDGFHNSGGFNKDNLKRRYSNSFGWYMHLHGSPLFVERDGDIYKISQSNLPTTHHEQKHLILTHYDYKLSLIEDSDLLSAYWEYFGVALKESRRLIIVGYSGLDKHVNERIQQHLSDFAMSVRIVEWSGAKGDRREFWKNCFGKYVDVTPCDNILDFDFASLY